MAVLEELRGVISSEAIRAQRMRKPKRDGRTHFRVIEGIPFGEESINDA